MAQVLVRNVDDATLQALKRRSKRHGKSLQQELKSILEEASRSELEDSLSVAKRMQERLRKRDIRYSDSGKLQSADRTR
jgi:plasmid stability protein